jgi:hypothetical protein
MSSFSGKKSSAPLLAPCEQLCHTLKIPGCVQRRSAHAKDEMGGSGLNVGVEFVGLNFPHPKEWRDCTLDFFGIASNFGTPAGKLTEGWTDFALKGGKLT